MCRGNLNPNKITKRAKIRHKKLLTQTCLDKGNELRIISCDNHVINIEEKKRIMSEKPAAMTIEAKR